MSAGGSCPGEGAEEAGVIRAQGVRPSSDTHICMYICVSVCIGVKLVRVSGRGSGRTRQDEAAAAAAAPQPLNPTSPYPL